MKLTELLDGLSGIEITGATNLDILGVQSDSRQVKAGDLFVAIRGFESDGHAYIDAAIANGAAAVVVEKDGERNRGRFSVAVIAVENPRLALAIIAGNFYGNPSRQLTLVGITGTKGKTTTSFMLRDVLESSGVRTGLIGTVGIYLGGEQLKYSARTTPESLELQQLFRQMLNHGVSTVIMEVSSQALKLDRVAGLSFDIAVFTNFSEDHIGGNEHSDMQDYLDSKAKLFSICKTAIFNADDEYAAAIASKTSVPYTTYGIDNPAQLKAKDIILSSDSASFTVEDTAATTPTTPFTVKVPTPGRFSVYNALATITVAKQLGVKPSNIASGLATVKVPGRNQLVPNNAGFTIIIDYAHSPHSLQSILESTRGYKQGELICVFGCGGDRDKGKRPMMGEIAGRLADFSIITSDNPRTEDPDAIIAQIEQGMLQTPGKYTTIENRRAAIAEALKLAQPNDVVLIAGKGHEKTQEINHQFFDFDEVQIVQEAIRDL